MGKVLIINGSPRKDGNCSMLIGEMKNTFDQCGVDVEEIQIGNLSIRGCLACQYCKSHKGCAIIDIVNETAPKLKEADGLIVVSPVYYASPNGTLISFLDRLFYSSNYDLRMKVGASFAVARRAGTSTTFDVLNKYFSINGMPIVSGDYWNNGFGSAKGEIKEDEEGNRNARIVAKRMSYLIKAIKEMRDKYPESMEDEERSWTNFIR